MQKMNMSIPTNSLASADCVGGKRNRFFRGKQMKAEEYVLEQTYGIEQRRLLNEAIVGWGVVRGLALRLETEKSGSPSSAASTPASDGTIGASLLVGAGLALDRRGREIVVGEPTELGAGNTFLLLQADGSCRASSLQNLVPGRYLLSVHYAERRLGDADLPHECGCPLPEKNFVCETATFSLLALADGPACPCAEPSCERELVCVSCEDGCVCGGRGPHGQLCHWLSTAQAPGPTKKLCEWHGVWLSLKDGVALACVTVAKSEDPCTPVMIASIDDACGPRRLVKNNDLLYDLLRGCDLTRISAISWQAWNRAAQAVPWQDFAAFFQEDGTTEFVVKFSGPVLTSSLQTDCIIVKAITVEQATGWLVARRVPVTALDLQPDAQQAAQGLVLPEGTTNQARLRVSKRWYRDELEAEKESWLSERDFTIEIEVRGDLIVDCRGQAVDGNAKGATSLPSGNGTPGGTFLSSFRVCRKPVQPSSELG